MLVALGGVGYLPRLSCFGMVMACHNRIIRHSIMITETLIRSSGIRADTVISNTDNIRNEKENIQTALHKCRYPRWAFQKAEKTIVTNTDSQKGRKQFTRATIPYIHVAGVSGRIKKVYAQFGTSTSFRPCDKLRNRLVRVKDITPKDKWSHLVYGIRSAAEPDCQEKYVGETKQALNSHVQQHQRPTRALVTLTGLGSIN